MSKKLLGIDVYTAARLRIAKVFDDFLRVYVSFSGGKDSGVMMHLVLEEAKKRNRKVGVLFVDLEGQYKITIDYVQQMFDMYADHIEPYWLCLPLRLRNAVSQYEPQWICWDKSQEYRWVRDMPGMAISDEAFFSFFRHGMEFEELVPEFGRWYAQGKLCACFVGIRSDESLNRYRTIAANKSMYENLKWTTWLESGLYNIYPIYDWKVDDVWHYYTRFGKKYNRLYDLMHQAGLTPAQMRICQPYGDDQRRGLWLFHVIEPETWAKVVARVNGVNQGALYAKESGNILGNQKITKPDGHTWQSFAMLLLESLPPNMREHYENKIAVFLKWYRDKGNPVLDEGDPKQESDRVVGSWRRICKTLLKNDYWCKGLSFSPTYSYSYEKYKKMMKGRRERWDLWI